MDDLSIFPSASFCGTEPLWNRPLTLVYTLFTPHI